jgi:hypothetical protein
MASRVANNINRAQFENLLNRWETRWRLRRIVLYLPRVLMAALGIGIIVTVILGLFRVLTPTMMAAVISGSIVAVVIIASSALGLFGKSGMDIARQFDKAFGLQERISTALELLDGRIKSAPELAELQIADAISRARDVDPRKHIKIEVNWLEWFGVLVLALVLALILGAYILFGAPPDASAAATQSAIQQAADDVRDITEEVATNSTLTDEERSNLLETLEVTLDDLSQDEATAEDGFVAMSELEADLSALAEEIGNETSADSSALAAAAEALQNPTNPNSSSEVTSRESPADLGQELAEMQQALSELTPEQSAQLQQQLSAAAQAMREQYPELAQQLQELAQNAQIGDTAITQEQLEQALENLENIQNSLEQRTDLAEQLQQAAQNAQQNADQIAQSESQQGQPQESEQQGQQDGQQQGQQGEGEQEQQGQPNQQGAGGQPQQSDSASNISQGNPADANIAVPSEGQEGEEGSQPGQVGEQPRDSQEGGAGGGAGEGEAGERQDGLSDQNQPASGENEADGQGETSFESVYAPNAIDTEGQGSVILEPDASDAPVTEGNFQENPTGESSVPYNQVFRSYEDAANRALENDYVPLGMQDVVRDYFSALQPAGEP